MHWSCQWVWVWVCVCECKNLCCVGWDFHVWKTRKSLVGVGIWNLQFVRALASYNSNSTLFYHFKKPLYHYTILFYNTSSIPNFYFPTLLIKIIYLHNKIIYPKIIYFLSHLFPLSLSLIFSSLTSARAFHLQLSITTTVTAASSTTTFTSPTRTSISTRPTIRNRRNSKMINTQLPKSHFRMAQILKLSSMARK